MKKKKWSRKGNCPICGVSTGSYHNDKKHKGIQTLNSDFLKGQSMGYKKGWEDGMKVMEKTILQSYEQGKREERERIKSLRTWLETEQGLERSLDHTGEFILLADIDVLQEGKKV